MWCLIGTTPPIKQPRLRVYSSRVDIVQKLIVLYALFRCHLHPLTTSNWYQHPRNSPTTLHPMDPPKAMRRSAPCRESSAPHISPAMTRSITPLPRSGNPKGGKNGNRILAASRFFIHLYTKLLIRYVLRKKLHPIMLSHNKMLHGDMVSFSCSLPHFDPPSPGYNWSADTKLPHGSHTKKLDRVYNSPLT